MTDKLLHAKHQFCIKTLELKDQIEGGFLELGQRLGRIKRSLMYEPHWSSWEEYLMELGISNSMASRLINIYERFVVDWKIAPAKLVAAGGWTVVAKILPRVTDRQDALEWLSKAKTLSRTDLGRELAEEETGLQQSDCKHPDAFLLRCCPDCQLKEKIYE